MKSLSDIIAEAQQEGAEIATLIADLQALEAASPAPAATPASVTVTDSVGNVFTGTLAPQTA